MTWVAWRQFRTQALVTLGLLAAFAALVLVTGLHLRDVYDSLGGARCAARNDCQALQTHDRALADLLGPALLTVPALLGMFWGAPLLARELESGTHRLAWTQSVTRRRWLSARVALAGAAALIVAGLASWLVSWWFAPLDHVAMNRLDPSVFTARGVVAIGYAGFAFALGVAAGALTRRTLPAMAATLLGFVAARIAFTLWVRPHLLASRHALFSLTDGKAVGFVGTSSGNVTVVGGAPPLPNAWAFSTTIVDRAHHALGAAQLHHLLVRTCPAIPAGKKAAGLGGGALISCLHSLSQHLQLLVAYQPPSRYWPLQALEAAIFLAGALALVGATVWRVGRRAARRQDAREPGERGAGRRQLVLTSVVLAAALALLGAGCGSSSPGSSRVPTSASTSDSGGQPTRAQMRQDVVAFSDCMRSRGVPGFPDPTSSPEGLKAALAPGAARTPAFRSAYAACRHLLPNDGVPPDRSAQRSPAQIDAFLAFARCIRRHGFANFPDPTSRGQLTHAMLARAGIDVHQPAVQHAADACVGVTHGFVTKADVARFVAGQ